MTELAVRVQNLGKCYRIGKGGIFSRPWWRPGKLRESDFPQSASASKVKKKEEIIWAIRNVSFELRQGEVLGIVGRNGAGKSTLLKVLARITAPTEGFAEIRGRMGALLEVGTGFHPELTGRENIFLSGAMIGMRRSEILRKFDEIVAFAELEQFIDTPVKRYSSGMYVRLAFAVAAHLEPDILLVDEVLAVGDAAFQRKCLGRMEGALREGRTIIFVSHNLAAINHLCPRSLLLENGRLVQDGSSTLVTKEYMRRSVPLEALGAFIVDTRVLDSQKDRGGAAFVVKEISLLDEGGNPLVELGTGDSFRLRVDFTVGRKIYSPAFEVSFKDHHGVEVARLSTMPISGFYIESLEGDGTIELYIQEIPLLGGTYSMGFYVARANVNWILKLEGVVSLNISSRDVYKSGMAMDNSRGLIALKHKWRLFRNTG